MRSLRMWLVIAVALSVVVSIAQAKTNYAYAVNNGDSTVSVINTSTNTVVKSIPVGGRPWGVAVNQAGTFAYVANKSSGTVSVISTSTNAAVATITVQPNPLNVAFTPNGKFAYVTNSDSVSVINTGTKKVAATIPGLGQPIGIAVTPNGAFVYVGNYLGGVSVISTLTNTVVATIGLPSANPISVAIS